tara:strand:+ start:186 stop:368 length:183 start_codon:yes stop_codon:yes gene_type:complete
LSRPAPSKNREISNNISKQLFNTLEKLIFQLFVKKREINEQLLKDFFSVLCGWLMQLYRF